MPTPSSLGIASHTTTTQLGTQNKPRVKKPPNMSGVPKQGPKTAPAGGLAGAVLGQRAPTAGVFQPSTPFAPPYQTPPLQINPSDGTPMPVPQIPNSWGTIGQNQQQQAMQPVAPGAQWPGTMPPTPQFGQVPNAIPGSPQGQIAPIPTTITPNAGNFQPAAVPRQPLNMPLNMTGQPTAMAAPSSGWNVRPNYNPAADAGTADQAVQAGINDVSTPEGARQFGKFDVALRLQRDATGRSLDAQEAAWQQRLAQARSSRPGWNSLYAGMQAANNPQTFDPPASGRKVTGYHEGGIAGGLVHPIYGMTPEQRATNAAKMQAINEKAQLDKNPGDYRYRPAGSSMGPDGNPIQSTAGQSRYDIAKSRRQDYLSGTGDFAPKEGEKSAYEQRQADLAQRRLNVTTNAMEEGAARDERLKARAEGPQFSQNPMLWQAMSRDPRTAVQMMALQQQGQLSQQRMFLENKIATNTASREERIAYDQMRQAEMQHQERMGQFTAQQQGTPLERIGAAEALRPRVEKDNPGASPAQIDAIIAQQIASANGRPQATAPTGQPGASSQPAGGQALPVPRWTTNPETGASLTPEEIIQRGTEMDWPDSAINGILKQVTGKPDASVDYPNGQGSGFMSGLGVAAGGLWDTLTGSGDAQARRRRRNNPNYQRPGRSRVKNREQADWARRAL